MRNCTDRAVRHLDVFELNNVPVRVSRVFDSEALASHKQLDGVPVRVDSDGLLLAEVALLPRPRVDEDHRLFCKVCLPEIVDVLRETEIVNPTLRINVVQR